MLNPTLWRFITIILLILTANLANTRVSNWQIASRSDFTPLVRDVQKYKKRHNLQLPHDTKPLLTSVVSVALLYQMLST